MELATAAARPAGNILTRLFGWGKRWWALRHFAGAYDVYAKESAEPEPEQVTITVNSWRSTFAR